MNIHEYQAREVLAAYGVPFPAGRVALTAAEAEAIAQELGGRVVVKAQVHAGGRGKAGGVKVCSSPAEAGEQAGAILGSSLKGHTVQRVLVVEAVGVAREFYLAVVLDRGRKTIVLMASAEGGVDIEDVAGVAPEAIARVAADPLFGLPDYRARDLALQVGLRGEEMRAFAAVAGSLYRAFRECDCSLLEVNPLALTHDGTFTALDAKMVIDDSALFRQPSLAALRDDQGDDLTEAEAQALGLSYIKLDGDIGCMVNGAGLAMATMDAIKRHGGDPANFLDIGGGAGLERVLAALDIILRDEDVRAVLVNVFGGITRCDIVAQGLVTRANTGGLRVPVVARLIGTNAAEGRRLLAGTGVELADGVSEAAERVVGMARAAGGRQA